MRALVLGATGHVGNAIVRELLSQGYQVTATSRRKEPALNLVGLAVHFVSGNIDTPGQLETWIAGHDVVVDAAAPYPLHLVSPSDEAERNSLAYAARRTDALLSAVRQAQARFAYVGSFTTHVRQQQGFDKWQMQLMRSLHPYFAVKALIENRVLAAAHKGVPAVVVNPTMCLGPWDLKERELCFIPQLLRHEMPACMSHVLNVVDVRDVAAGIVTALQAERYGESILLSGHNIPSDVLFSWICQIGGARPPRFSVPASLGLLASYGIESFLALFGQRSPLPSLAAMLICEMEWLAPSAAQCELGITTRPLSETLLDAVAWYRALGYC